MGSWREQRKFLLRAAYIAVWVALIAAAVTVAVKWALPLVLAAVTAVLLHRPLRHITVGGRPIRRIFAAALVTLVVAAVGGVLLLVGWRVAVWAQGQLSADAPGRWLSAAGEMLRGMVGRLSRGRSAEIGSLTDALIGGIGEKVGGWLSSLAAGILQFTAEGLPRLLLAVFVWFLGTVMLLMDYEGLRAAALAPLSEKKRALVTGAIGCCFETARSMVGAYGLLCLITFAELGVGLSLLRIPGAWGLSALIAVVDILPVLGVGTVLIPWAAVCFISGGAARGAGLLALYLVISVVRNVTEPHLISRKAGIHPLLTLSLMYIGGRAAGIAGIFLFPFAGVLAARLYAEGYFG